MAPMIGDFFKQLFMGKVERAKFSAVGKAYGAQVKVKTKIAGSFNKAVDKGVNVVKPGQKAKADAKDDKSKEKGKMGLFSFGKKGSTQQTAVGDEDVGDAKTQAINIAAYEDSVFKPCVGWVVVMNGQQQGRDFRLVAGRNRIGTAADMEVVLTDPYVSSHHATIVYNDEGIYQLSDAGSTNGTRVNGKRVMQSQIIDNDALQIGHTEMRFKALD